MPRKPKNEAAASPAERKKSSRQSGRLTAEQINKAILKEYKRSLSDHYNDTSKCVDVWEIYKRLCNRFPDDIQRLSNYLLPVVEDGDEDGLCYSVAAGRVVVRD